MKPIFRPICWFLKHRWSGSGSYKICWRCGEVDKNLIPDFNLKAPHSEKLHDILLQLEAEGTKFENGVTCYWDLVHTLKSHIGKKNEV